MWTKRVLMGAGLAVGSLLIVPGVAGAGTTTGCYTGCEPPTVVASGPPPTTPTVTPATPSVTPTAAAPATSSSLPFTGVDVEELAAVGGAAILAGALLARRRRTA